MKIVEQKVVLKNGISVILRSPDERDAAALLLHTKITASESHFLVKTVKEAEKLTLEQERILVNAVNESRDSFIIAAFSPDGTVLASAELDAVERRAKTRHRAAFGIAVQRRVWNGGLGTLLTDMATKARRYSSVAQTNSPGYQKIASMPEEKIAEFVSAQIADCNKLMAILNAMDDFFKNAAAPANKSKISAP